jgi:hypothetical protein
MMKLRGIGWPYLVQPRGVFRLPCRAPLAAVAGILLASSLPAQKLKPTENELKAVYLFNFARFTQWPSSTGNEKNGSFLICVLGQDPFGASLDAVVSGETIGGNPVVAKRISRSQDALSCQVLYISSSEEGQLKEVLNAVDKASVLTVSDIPQFSRRGGIVQFVMENNRVRFEVNLANATGARLNLSSELLKVAVKVLTSPPPGD